MLLDLGADLNVRLLGWLVPIVFTFKFLGRMCHVVSPVSEAQPLVDCPSSGNI